MIIDLNRGDCLKIKLNNLTMFIDAQDTNTIMIDWINIRDCKIVPSIHESSVKLTVEFDEGRDRT